MGTVCYYSLCSKEEPRVRLDIVPALQLSRNWAKSAVGVDLFKQWPPTCYIKTFACITCQYQTLAEEVEAVAVVAPKQAE